LVGGYSYSSGAIVTDPAVALKDLQAKFQTGSVSAIRSFAFFKKTSQVLVAIPYAWGEATALVNGQPGAVTRSGLADLRVRWSVLLAGAPAMTVQEMARAKAPRKTVIGSSITISAPSGEYFNDKLINIGTNRWGFKPELAVSHPFGKKWLIDFYTAVWLFTNNDSFFPGSSFKTQSPLTAFQAHLSYNISLRAWVAFNATYYVGGGTTVNGTENADDQQNSRLGATLVVPVGKMNSIKFAISRGAIIRAGANFTSASVGWQWSFVKVPTPPRKN
jgi:hypothetical protein